MEANVNRVYINPNFSRPPNNLRFASNQTTSRNYLHVNPHYSLPLLEQQNVEISKRIYVNPNFIKSNNSSDNTVNKYSEKLNIKYNNIGFKDSNFFNKEYLHLVHSSNENPKALKNISPCIVSKSKYRLVRNNINRNTDKKHQAIKSCTIKISKYKSIPLHNFKINMQLNKPETHNKPKEPIRSINVATPKYVSKTSFKLIRQDQVTTTVPFKSTPRFNSLKTKKHDLSLQMRLTVLKNMRKKNNIPCRLFTKYGKCLRNMSGTCQYLHDKKHVSLCRKFIKGICHDKNCLLSHELSSKKMPTCYFYLRGMCVKEHCPYTHVKVSEKSKICQDFIKGYCDKGDTCPYRHTTPHANNRNYKKGVNTHSNGNISFIKTVKVKESPLVKNKVTRQLRRKRSESKLNEKYCTNEQNKQDDEGRYFKDLNNEDDMCEILKPTRCKLGTLPSFIQL